MYNPSEDHENYQQGFWTFEQVLRDSGATGENPKCPFLSGSKHASTSAKTGGHFLDAKQTAWNHQSLGRFGVEFQPSQDLSPTRWS